MPRLKPAAPPPVAPPTVVPPAPTVAAIRIEDKIATQAAYAALTLQGSHTKAEACALLDVPAPRASQWESSEWYALARVEAQAGTLGKITEEGWMAETRQRRDLVLRASQSTLEASEEMLRRMMSGEMALRAKDIADVSKAINNAQLAHRTETGEELADKKTVADAGKSNAAITFDVRGIYAALSADQKENILIAAGDEPKQIEPPTYEVECD